MSRPTPPTYKTRHWPAYNEALKRRGSLTIWFDPEMIWDAAPSGRRGRQQSYSDAAIQMCLSMKVLFGMALRQTTGFVESLLRLAGLDWAVPDFSTLSRRQKTLAVNIPYSGSRGPLHLLIDSTGSRSRAKANGMRASTVARSGVSGARSLSGSTSKHWRSELSRSPGATSVMRPFCPTCSARPRRDETIGSVTADGAYDTRKCHDAIADRGAHAVIPPRKNAKPWKIVTAGAVARNEALRASKDLGRALLATMERIPPPKPRRDEEALRETAGPATHGTGLRPPGRRPSGPHRRPERLHRARHPCHRALRISPSGEGGNLGDQSICATEPIELGTGCQRPLC